MGGSLLGICILFSVIFPQLTFITFLIVVIKNLSEVTFNLDRDIDLMFTCGVQNTIFAIALLSIFFLMCFNVKIKRDDLVPNEKQKQKKNVLF